MIKIALVYKNKKQQESVIEIFNEICKKYFTDNVRVRFLSKNNYIFQIAKRFFPMIDNSILNIDYSCFYDIYSNFNYSSSNNINDFIFDSKIKIPKIKIEKSVLDINNMIEEFGDKLNKEFWFWRLMIDIKEIENLQAECYDDKFIIIVDDFQSDEEIEKLKKMNFYIMHLTDKDMYFSELKSLIEEELKNVIGFFNLSNIEENDEELNQALEILKKKNFTPENFDKEWNKNK